MGGFKNKTLNNEFISGVVNHTITHLIKCSEQMISDCLENNNPLWNDEDRITNRLVEKYLNNGSSNYRYIIQSPENFDDKTDQYIGRTDIIVISKNYFIDSKAYFIIECK